MHIIYELLATSCLRCPYKLVITLLYIYHFVGTIFVCVFSCADAQDRQDRANKTLLNVKAGIEHLADKLQHLKAVRIRFYATQLKTAAILYSLSSYKPFKILLCFLYSPKAMYRKRSCRQPQMNISWTYWARVNRSYSNSWMIWEERILMTS